MLCILFTHKKLIAGSALNKPEIYIIQGNYYTDYQNANPEEILHNNLSEIKQRYLDTLRSERKIVPARIPVVVGFSPFFSADENARSVRNGILDAIDSIDERSMEVIRTEYLSNAYLYGLQQADFTGSNNVVLDALDDQVMLYYGSQSGRVSQNGSAQELVSIDGLGVEAGRKHVLEQLIAAFEKSGLALDEYDKADLSKQIVSPMRNGTYTIIKSNDIINITARANISERQYEDYMSYERAALKPYVSREALEEKGIQEVILMGNYLKNPVLKEYLVQELELEDRLVLSPSQEENADFKAILSGLHNLGVEEIRRREEEERRRREEEERRRQLELKAQADRDALMAEIREKCVDSDLQVEYEEMYIQRGERLGLPKEVIRWNIQEALKIAALKPESASPQQIFNSQELVAASAVTSNSSRSSQTPSVPAIPSPSHDSGIPTIAELFEIRGVLPDTEFTTKKVFDKESKQILVLRMIPARSMNDADAMQRFTKLYNKELKYYGELSDIKVAAEGKYYFRNFIERNTLRDYIRKTDIYNKRDINDLSSGELKLILQVMKEVSDLQISHADLNENNILVVYKRKWGLQRDITISLVGFTSHDIPKEEMEKQVHDMWSRLLGDEFYQEFRKKFNI